MNTRERESCRGRSARSRGRASSGGTGALVVLGLLGLLFFTAAPWT